MTKEEALAQFYKKNKINISEFVNDKTERGIYEKYIANLSEKIDQWLEDIAKEDWDAFFALLSRYTYLTEEECQIRYCKIVELLETKLQKLKYTFDDVLVITVESTNGVKSGAENVSADFYKRNSDEIPKEQLITALSKITKEKIAQYSVLVFLDDTIGSSKTLSRVIQSFYDSYKDVLEHKSLFYACIAPRKCGIARLKRSLKKLPLKVEPLFDNEWIIDSAVKADDSLYPKIKAYEEKIGYFFDVRGKSYFMGFEKGRITLSFYYNTPNNTLSTFWREIPEQHKPLFKRDGDQPSLIKRTSREAPVNRPSILKLKENRRKFQDTAYKIAEAKGEEKYAN